MNGPGDEKKQLITAPLSLRDIIVMKNFLEKSIREELFKEQEELQTIFYLRDKLSKVIIDVSKQQNTLKSK